MSRQRHASVFICFFVLVTGACESSEDTPNQESASDAGDSTGTSSGNQVSGGAGSKAGASGNSSGTQPSRPATAGAPSTKPSTGSTGGADSGIPATGSSTGGAASGQPPAAGAGSAGQSAQGDQDAGAPDDDKQPGKTGDCVVGGCSSQLCTDAADGPIVSTCEWREEYACYRDATCERQSSGQCGWTQTPELSDCLKGAGTP